MATPVPYDVRALELFLKQNRSGPQVADALRLRTASHWLNPSVDRLSSRMLVAYDKLCELVVKPFHILDAGCMCGFLRHRMVQRLGNTFRYVGVDNWTEAIEVAKEWQPGVEFHLADILTDELPRPESGQWDYVWCSNIAFADPEAVIVKLMLFGKTLFIAQPPWCGDWSLPAMKYGEVETFDCGETTLTKITNGS